MKRIPLNFCYKGSRNYVQGGDIYNEVVRAVCESNEKNSLSAPFRLVMHQFSHTHCDMILDQPGIESSRPENPVAEFMFYTQEGHLNGWLLETDRPIECRIPYDEGSIEKLCMIDREGKVIRISGSSAFSPIEVVISMTKQLHYALYPTADKWIFTRLDLDRLLQKGDEPSFRIEVEHNFNNRLTKSRISSGPEFIGHIYFTLIKK